MNSDCPSAPPGCGSSAILVSVDKDGAMFHVPDSLEISVRSAFFEGRQHGLASEAMSLDLDACPVLLAACLCALVLLVTRARHITWMSS